MRRTANFWLPLLLIGLAVAMTFLNSRLQTQFSTYDDFAPRWSAARWWLKTAANPYGQETFDQSRQIQADYQLTPNDFDQGHFIDPAFYIYFVLPLSVIDFPIARAIWMTLLEFAVVITVWLAIDLVGLKVTMLEKLIFSVLILAFPPVAKSILSASLLPLFMLFLVWGCRLGLQKQGTGAGILLLLCFAMLPESVLVAIFLMAVLGARRDDSFLRVYIVGILFLLLVTWILFPGWIGDWFANFIRLHPDFSWINTPINHLAQTLPAGSKIFSIVLHALVGVWLLVEWFGLGRFNDRKLIWKLALSLNLIYFFNTLTQGVYLLLVLPALFLGFKFLIEKWGIVGRIISWIGYLGIISIYINRFFSEPDLSFREPTFIALFLPIVTLLGLQWFRWWATESPRALIEKSL